VHGRGPDGGLVVTASERRRTNPVVDTYSRLADEYDDPKNIESCWGRVTQHSLELVGLRERHRTVADLGCGTGRELARLAAVNPADLRLFGVEPAANMRRRAMARTAQYPNVRILGGSFEHLPLRTRSIDYLYSILAFHWTTDLEASVAELARVLTPTGEMDLTFIGRHNGREFIRATTPVFVRYLTPAAMVKAASLRKQLTVEEATALFAAVFHLPGLTVAESYHTYHDTLEGHWGWWVRIEGQFVDIPPGRQAECDRAVRDALASLATDTHIPYTVHLLHVRLRNREGR
jgi:ubiquinone/menaquinone biosynthesis C-methylase UbiE